VSYVELCACATLGILKERSCPRKCGQIAIQTRIETNSATFASASSTGERVCGQFLAARGEFFAAHSTAAKR
jgi:hypothetical protein